MSYTKHKSTPIQVQVGPGIWFSIHIIALEATTTEKKNNFINYMMMLKEYFPCPHCREDIIKYLNDNPIPKYFDKNIGYFEYTWIFHNYVNKKLKKPEIEFDFALNLYKKIPGSECDGRCTDNSIEENDNITKKQSNSKEFQNKNNTDVYILNKTNNKFTVRNINFVRSSN